MPKGLNPSSAILEGNAENGSVHFHVTQTIGVAESLSKCAMTSATVAPFPPTQLAFDFKEDPPCNGGQLLLRRVPQ
jgi:hypothetical protein